MKKYFVLLLTVLLFSLLSNAQTVVYRTNSFGHETTPILIIEGKTISRTNSFGYATTPILLIDGGYSLPALIAVLSQCGIF